LIAMPIEVVRARRIAWLGFSLAAISSGEWMTVTPVLRLACCSNSSPTRRSSPKIMNCNVASRRRAREAPAIIAAGPPSPPIASIAMRGPPAMTRPTAA
jgi:hypothetical protein